MRYTLNQVREVCGFKGTNETERSRFRRAVAIPRGRKHKQYSVAEAVMMAVVYQLYRDMRVRVNYDLSVVSWVLLEGAPGVWWYRGAWCTTPPNGCPGVYVPALVIQRLHLEFTMLGVE